MIGRDSRIGPLECNFYEIRMRFEWNSNMGFAETKITGSFRVYVVSWHLPVLAFSKNGNVQNFTIFKPDLQ